MPSAEEMKKRFYGAVSPSANVAGTPRTIQRGSQQSISPDYGTTRTVDPIADISKKMMDATTRNVGRNFSKSERSARIGSRQIQALDKIADMYAAQGITDTRQQGATSRALMNEAGQNARQRSQFNQSQLNKNRDRGWQQDDAGRVRQQQLQDQSWSRQNTAADATTLYDRGLEQDTLEDQRKREADNRSFAQALISSGSSGSAQLENLYNQPGTIDASLQGLSVPTKPTKKKYIDPIAPTSLGDVGTPARVFDESTGTTSAIDAMTPEEQEQFRTFLLQQQGLK